MPSLRAIDVVVVGRARRSAQPPRSPPTCLLGAYDRRIDQMVMDGIKSKGPF